MSFRKLERAEFDRAVRRGSGAAFLPVRRQARL